MGEVVDLQRHLVAVGRPRGRLARLVHGRVADQPVNRPVELGPLQLLAKGAHRRKRAELDLQGREVVGGEVAVERGVAHLVQIAHRAEHVVFPRAEQVRRSLVSRDRVSD